ncbi:MAG: hypothetical protein CVV32_06310 [Methanomicrobiales archaeon HGW-Methanomicrobiales-3]|nr:MAG: hypothetical protein CVV32_06310 [Methanomicrobiales archaeon HGW-Methanomicrobiales-3]
MNNDGHVLEGQQVIQPILIIKDQQGSTVAWAPGEMMIEEVPFIQTPDIKYNFTFFIRWRIALTRRDELKGNIWLHLTTLLNQSIHR